MILVTISCKGKDGDSIVLKLIPNKKEYKLNDTIRIEVLVINNTDSAIRIPKPQFIYSKFLEGYQPQCYIEFYKMGHRDKKLSMAASIPKIKIRVKDIITVNAHDSIRLIEDKKIYERNTSLFKYEGEYVFELHYYLDPAMLEKEFENMDVKLLKLKKLKLVSNSISIKITK
jgi:hypothetical protein